MHINPQESPKARAEIGFAVPAGASAPAHPAPIFPTPLAGADGRGSNHDPIAAGYVHAVIAEGGPHSLELLVRPETDFDSRFRAWDMAEGEWLLVNGWLFVIEALEPVQ